MARAGYQTLSSSRKRLFSAIRTDNPKALSNALAEVSSNDAEWLLDELEQVHHTSRYLEEVDVRGTTVDRLRQYRVLVLSALHTKKMLENQGRPGRTTLRARTGIPQWVSYLALALSCIALLMSVIVFISAR